MEDQMRKTMSFGIAALVVAVIASAWMMAPSSKAQTGDTAANEAGMMDPIGMMKRVKDLPVHNILDLI
jgi:long-subunit fatty acid transport protein